MSVAGRSSIAVAVMAISVPAIGTPDKNRFGDVFEDQSVTGGGHVR
jgi:hypothetical protein